APVAPLLERLPDTGAVGVASNDHRIRAGVRVGHDRIGLLTPPTGAELDPRGEVKAVGPHALLSDANRRSDCDAQRSTELTQMRQEQLRVLLDGPARKNGVAEIPVGLG